MTQTCCEPVLQSSTEECRKQFALTSAAVHGSWFTAHLYEEHNSIGVTAETQSCSGPVLQSSTEQCGMHLALTSAAVHWYWFTAHLYEEQISIGVLALTQPCCNLICTAALSSWDCFLPNSSVATLNTRL